MTKRQLIDEIRQFNSEARLQFLSQFDEASLKEYLEHLKVARQRNIRIAGWVRGERKLRMVS